MQPDVRIEEKLDEMNRSEGKDAYMKPAEQRQKHTKDT